MVRFFRSGEDRTRLATSEDGTWESESMVREVREKGCWKS